MRRFVLALVAFVAVSSGASAQTDAWNAMNRVQSYMNLFTQGSNMLGQGSNMLGGMVGGGYGGNGPMSQAMRGNSYQPSYSNGPMSQAMGGGGYGYQGPMAQAGGYQQGYQQQACQPIGRQHAPGVIAVFDSCSGQLMGYQRY